jgi:hypothetical protein
MTRAAQHSTPESPAGSCASAICRRVDVSFVTNRDFSKVDTGEYGHVRPECPTVGRARKEDVRLPGKGNLNPYGARPIHQI